MERILRSHHPSLCETSREGGEIKENMFLHLHTHSNYSFCRGADTIRDLCTAAKIAGMEKLALTDTNGLYGMHWFIKAAKEEGVIPIIGAQLVDESANAVRLAKDDTGASARCRVFYGRRGNRGNDENGVSLTTDWGW